jgi:enoyl-CoA hydratase/carnithine racemase
MSELVTMSMDGCIADVRLNRPEKYNALSWDMMTAIAATLKRLAGEKGIRAVVLSGAGRGFCAGLDVEHFFGGPSGMGPGLPDLRGRYQGGITNLPQHIAYGWRQLPMPVIAAVHGVAFGGGCQIALGADIRLSSPDAKLSIMEIKWGLVPDMAATQTLRDLVAIDTAKELIFTGRIVSGETAARLGLVTRTCENPREAAKALAAEIAARSPDAVRAAKQLLNSAWHGSTADGLQMESEAEQALIGQPNQIEAIKANFEKRPPKFRDPGQARPRPGAP